MINSNRTSGNFIFNEIIEANKPIISNIENHVIPIK